MNKITKENFLKVMNSMSKEELNNYIKDKGKPPKLIRPIVVLDKEISR